MDPFSAVLIGGSVAQGGLSIFTAIRDAQRRRLQGKYQKESFDFNADVSDWQAEGAIRRGSEEANSVRSAGRQVRGSARAAAAAQGLDVDSGSMAELQAEATDIAEIDARQVENNAWLESWGMKLQAKEFRGAGRMAELGADQEAASTLLAGGMQAAGSFLNAASHARSGLSLGYQKRVSDKYTGGGSGSGSPFAGSGQRRSIPRPD